MTDCTIRSWRPSDQPQLRQLWHEVFGDDLSYIDSFQAHLLHPDGCVVAEADGRIISAMYILTGIRLPSCPFDDRTAGYIYALATLPEYRGHGIGRAVCRAAAASALETCGAAFVLPAEASLYPFYENILGAVRFGGIREETLAAADLIAPDTPPAVRISAKLYAETRERLLSEKPHASFPAGMYAHMENTGTEFFMLDNAAAAAESHDGVCRIQELIAPDGGWMNAAASVAALCPADEYIVRTPLFFDGPERTRPFMLASFNAASDHPLPDDFWWGFGMD